VPRFILEYPALSSSGAFSFLSTELFQSGALGVAGGAMFLFDFIEKQLAGAEPVLGLGPFLFATHLQAGGPMREDDCGGSFVDVLTSRATRAGENFFDVLFTNPKFSHSF
jgi:hypothetical protein